MEQMGMSWTGGQSMSMATKLLWSAQDEKQQKTSSFSLGRSFVSDLLKSYYEDDTESGATTRSQYQPETENGKPEYPKRRSPFQKRSPLTHRQRSTNDTVTTASSTSSIDPHDEVGSEDESLGYRQRAVSPLRSGSPHPNMNPRSLSGRISPVRKFRRIPVGTPIVLHTVAEGTEQDDESCTNEEKPINHSKKRNANPFVLELFGSSDSSDNSTASASTLISAETSLSGGKGKGLLSNLPPHARKKTTFHPELVQVSSDSSESDSSDSEQSVSSVIRKIQADLSASSIQHTLSDAINLHNTVRNAPSSAESPKHPHHSTRNHLDLGQEAHPPLHSEATESSSLLTINLLGKNSTYPTMDKKSPYLLALSSSSERSSSESNDTESEESAKIADGSRNVNFYEFQETNFSFNDDSGESFDSTRAVSPSKVIQDSDNYLLVEGNPSPFGEVTIRMLEPNKPDSSEAQYMSSGMSERSTTATSLSSARHVNSEKKVVRSKVLPSAFRLSPASLQTLHKYKESLNATSYLRQKTRIGEASLFVSFPEIPKYPSQKLKPSTRSTSTTHKFERKDLTNDVPKDDTGWDEIFQSWFECATYLSCAVDEDDTQHAFRTSSRFVKTRLVPRIYKWKKDKAHYNGSVMRKSVFSNKRKGYHAAAIRWSMKMDENEYGMKWEDSSLPGNFSQSDLPPWSEDNVDYLNFSWDSLEIDTKPSTHEPSPLREVATTGFGLQSEIEIEFLPDINAPEGQETLSIINHTRLHIVPERHFQRPQDILRQAGQISRRKHCQFVHNRLQRRRIQAAQSILWIMRLNLFRRHKASKMICSSIRFYAQRRNNAARTLCSAIRVYIKLRQSAAQTILRAMKHFKQQRDESTALIRRAFAREVARKALDHRIRMKRRTRFVESTTMVQRHVLKAAERQEKARRTETVMKRALKMLHAQQKEKKRRRALRYSAAKIIFRAMRFYHFKQAIERRVTKRKYLKIEESRRIAVERHRHWREHRLKERSKGASRRS